MSFPLRLRLVGAALAPLGLALFLAPPGCGGDDAVDNNGDDLDATTPGPDAARGEGGAVDGGCSGLSCQQVTCPPGQSTTVSGDVLDPAGKVALYNVAVYVPNGPVAPIVSGATCDFVCGGVPSASAIVSTFTDVNGHFVLRDVPVGTDIPLVVQVGKWRRKLTVPTVAKCVDTPLPDKTQTRLPRNQAEGDIPLIAVATGAADAVECFLRRVGIDDAEFTPAGGTGRVHLYAGSGGTSAFAKPDGGPDSGVDAAAIDAGTFAPATPFWSDVAALRKYDQLLLGCEGAAHPETKPTIAVQAVFDYLAGGGRVFAWHYHHYWFSSGPAPFPQVGTWGDFAQPPDPATATIDVSTAKGKALSDWLMATGATTVPGTLLIKSPRANITAVDPTKALALVTLAANDAGPEAGVVDAGPKTAFEVTFQTPLTVPEAERCGRVDYSDLHVAAAGEVPGPAFPTECRAGDLSPQEKAIEFLLFDARTCVK
jgi:hypothetical protein